jgi:hypothetical protein
MQTIQLNVDALKVISFTTTKNRAGGSVLARTEYCTVLTSGVSETDGVFNCKSCGPCCSPA